MKYKPLHPIIDEHETILANFWRRFLAFIIDLIVIMALIAILINIIDFLGLQLTKVSIKGFHEIEINAVGASETGISFLKIGFASIPTIYFTLMNYFSNGKTIGKWIMRIRIVSLYHHRISFWHCVERALGYAASALEAGLGFLQIFWNSNRMCLHDRIAETIVIQEKRKIKKKK